jgi:hypothetical protein
MMPSDNNVPKKDRRNDMLSSTTYDEWVRWMLEDMKYQAETYRANINAIEVFGKPIMPFDNSVGQLMNSRLQGD